jgi:hypothetical protein
MSTGCDKNWPIMHINGNTAKSTTLLNGTEGEASHWITGYHLDGALATADGFHLLRRSCLYFNTTDTWTAADGGALLDIANEASTTGHFSFEVWMYVPSATGAQATVLVRAGGGATEGYTLSVTSAGIPKFTAHDGTAAITATATNSIFDRWAFVVVTCTRNSATGLKIYIDGVEETLSAGSADTTGLNDAIDAAGTLVSTGVSNKDFWLGPVGFYSGASGALSAATVLKNYNNGFGRKYHGGETGLVLAWNNDEGTGTVCYSITNDDGYKSTISGATWSPAKQSASTAAQNRCGPPFEKKGEKDADEPLGTLGPFVCGVLTTSGVVAPVSITFPEAIKIGRGNPVRILETDGTTSLMLFGRTR